MPTVPNFPSELSDQHHHWHNPGAHAGAGPGRVHPMGSSGGGLEFLTFHRNFMAQFFTWYNSTTFTEPPFDDPTQKADLVATWTSVPAELQDASLGWTATWAADADRLDSGTPDFASADDLGTFIEVGIHNQFLHGASAAFFGEPILNSFHSPESSVFYKIHGLVGTWWSTWQMRHKRFTKELIIEKPPWIEVFKDQELKNRGAEVKFATREVFDPFKLIDPVINPAVDPVLVESLHARLTRVEGEVFPMSATFIRSMERPAVAQHIADEGKMTPGTQG